MQWIVGLDAGPGASAAPQCR